MNSTNYTRLTDEEKSIAICQQIAEKLEEKKCCSRESVFSWLQKTGYGRGLDIKATSINLNLERLYSLYREYQLSLIYRKEV